MVRPRRNQLAEISTAIAQPNPPAPPMKVTVDELALRTLYERLLTSRLALGANYAGNGSGRREVLIAATIDLHAGDAVAKSEDVIHSTPGMGDSLHILPSHLGLAAGVALAYKLQGDHHVVVALRPASALDHGSSHETLNYASSQKLPLVVVVDGGNADAIDAKAAAYGIPSISVDANDAVAIYRVSREAIDRARAGRGPSLIQCLRTEPEVDPIPHLEKYLEKHGWWSPAWKRELTSRSSKR